MPNAFILNQLAGLGNSSFEENGLPKITTGFEAMSCNTMLQTILRN
jgi:hypothetical protein